MKTIRGGTGFGGRKTFQARGNNAKRRATAGLIKRIVSSIWQHYANAVLRACIRALCTHTSEPRILCEETPQHGCANRGEGPRGRGRIERIYSILYIEMSKADAKLTRLLPNKTHKRRKAFRYIKIRPRLNERGISTSDKC